MFQLYCCKRRCKNDILHIRHPKINSVSGLKKKIVNADEQKVSYEIFDSIGISKIDVYYYIPNGEQVGRIRATEGGSVTDVLSDLTSYSGEFTISNSTSAQPVRIYIKDFAGNVTDTDNEDFDIDSIALIVYNKSPKY